MICKQCGKTFTEKYSKWSNGDFCCKQCARKYSNSKCYKTKIGTCCECGTQVNISVNYPTKYINNICCDECKHKHYLKRKREEYKKRIEKIKLLSNNICINCGEHIANKRKFCSGTCVNEYKHKMKMEEVKNKNGVGCNFIRIKEYLEETRGHKCEICGISEWLGKSLTLILDHINGRASDNRLENLRLICSNCDSQLPTYKSKNKNSDRIKRKGYW